MKQIVTGIIAHVDSGKTTLAEAMLFASGAIRSQGRVDHGNAFLDTNSIEKEKGITIFSKQAIMTVSDTSFTILDTPGHVDFSTETERTLSVLDYCILVISGSDGVRSHTQTLWKLLKRYNVPTFIFVNKMDISHFTKDELIRDIQENLSPNCVELSDIDSVVLCDESLMDEYLKTDTVTAESVANAIKNRSLFPCFFGSALKLTGINEFLVALSDYTRMPQKNDKFSATVYKITTESDGTRLTHLKVTGGELKAKSVLEFTDKNSNPVSEKIDTIRIYQGDKYSLSPTVAQGSICAVSGLMKTYQGLGLGDDTKSEKPFLEPLMTYKVEILDNTDIHSALLKLRILEEEDPQLNIIWNELLREIHLRLMGEVQIEVLRKIIRDRFGIGVDFVEGSIAYRETIENKVEGVGHFEPLRHYSEVHLVLEPLKRGQGIVVKSDCSEDMLERNWQRLILTHIKEKMHTGPLTNSPITDVKITLVSGKAHKKHTEGGDFRQATYRAIRHALMKAQKLLLEPYYDFKAYVPTECVGRAMTDFQVMGAEFSSPEASGDMSVIKGSAPVSAMRSYQAELLSYTSGKGKLFTVFKGYDKCHNSDEVIEKIAYDPETDTDNPASSVFCEHGAGFTVNWQDVENYMHLPSALKDEAPVLNSEQNIREYVNSVINDEELLRIFEKTYGPVKVKAYKAMENRIKKPSEKPQRYIKKPSALSGRTYLLVDGYNIIFAWDSLKDIAKDNLDLAREMLTTKLCNFQGYTQCEVILVFDAYKVKGGTEKVEKVNNISVVYTKEAETADAYIERVTHELTKNHRVRVATSDGLEQLIILGKGAERVSASMFLKELTDAEDKIREFIKNM